MPGSKLSVGNVEVTALTDIELEFPLSDLFPNIPAEAWAPYRQRYPESFSGPDKCHIHFGGYLLRSQGRTILVDTGLGSSATNPDAVATFAGGTDGRLLDELQAVGVRPEDVDTVFFTHLHPDHVGWNLSREGEAPRLTFPRARHLAHQADWDAFKKPEVHGAFPFKFWEETTGPLEALGVLDLLSGEHALTSEITAVHTPGHMSVAIVSQGERAMIMGDVAGLPAQVTETDWCHVFEMDPAETDRTRRWLFDRLEAENAIMVTCHYPPPGYGRLVRVEGRRYWQGL